MNDARPTMTHRQVMQRLRTDQWRTAASLGGSVGEGTLNTLARNGWIERNGGEVRLTEVGLEAVRAKLPHAGKMPLPRPQVRPSDTPDELGLRAKGKA
jgi:hypothetical protein